MFIWYSLTKTDKNQNQRPEENYSRDTGVRCYGLGTETKGSAWTGARWIYGTPERAS